MIGFWCAGDFEAFFFALGQPIPRWLVMQTLPVLSDQDRNLVCSWPLSRRKNGVSVEQEPRTGPELVDW